MVISSPNMGLLLGFPHYIKLYSLLNQVQPSWSIINHHQLWTIMNNHEQSWTIINTYYPLLTITNHYTPSWPSKHHPSIDQGGGGRQEPLAASGGPVPGSRAIGEARMARGRWGILLNWPETDQMGLSIVMEVPNSWMVYSRKSWNISWKWMVIRGKTHEHRWFIVENPI